MSWLSSRFQLFLQYFLRFEGTCITLSKNQGRLPKACRNMFRARIQQAESGSYWIWNLTSWIRNVIQVFHHTLFCGKWCTEFWGCKYNFPLKFILCMKKIWSEPVPFPHRIKLVEEISRTSYQEVWEFSDVNFLMLAGLNFAPDRIRPWGEPILLHSGFSQTGGR